MGKRGAEDQLTKDDVESGGAEGSDEEGEAQVRRDAPKEALAGRQIRGLPKRKPAPNTNTVPAASTAGSATASSFGAAPKTNTPAFSFSNPSSASNPSNSFAFSAPSPSSNPKPAPAPNSNPFGGFAFGSAASTASKQAPVTAASSSTGGSSLFAFGAGSSATSNPSSGGAGKSGAFGSSGLAPPLSSAQPAVSTSAAGASEQPTQAKSPFAAFSFGAPAATAPTHTGPSSSAGMTNSSATKSIEPAMSAPQTNKPSPFSGFSFGAPVAASTGGASDAPAVNPSPGISSDIGKSAEPKATSSEADKVSDSEDDKTFTYLTSIRGLNESVIRALEVACRTDPFVDLGEALGRLKREYEAELRGIKRTQGEVDGDEGTKRMDVEVQEPETIASSVEKQSLPSAPAPVQPLFQPPQVISQKLAPLPTSASTSTTAAGGFKPSAPITAFSFGGKTIGVGADTNATSAPSAAPAFSGFVFKPTTAATTTPSKPTSAAAALVQGMLDDQDDSSGQAQAETAPATTTPAKPPTFSFASTTPTSSPAPPSLAKRPSAIFAIKPEVRKSVGGGANSMVVPKSSDASNPVPFVFKANNTGFNIGSSGSTTAPAPTAGAPGGFGFSPMNARTNSAGFSFGKTDSTTATPAGGQGSVPSKPAFSFGAPAAPTSANTSAPTSAFAFGKPVEGAAKPPAFSFGAPSTLMGGDGAGSKPPVFGFGAPAATQASGSSAPATNATTDIPGAGPDASSVDASAPQSGLTTGAGEEDEETLWESKAQIGVLQKNDEGKMVWADWKVCMVKLKRENKKEGQDDSQPMRRMLMRVDPSGHVHQNFSLRSLHTILPLGPSGLKLSVAETGGLKQIGMRFGKKSAAFDPEPIMQMFKSSVNAERRAMKLGEV